MTSAQLEWSVDGSRRFMEEFYWTVCTALLNARRAGLRHSG
jgi:hypothetical protein